MNPDEQAVAVEGGDALSPRREEFRYWAFISYSHADDEWAKWAHRAIETYRIPRQLWGRPSPFGPLPRRLFPVFRDRDELPSASDLGAKLQDSLRASRNLVVICSARAAVSRWVNEEIRTFKSWKRESRVFAIIVDGEPNASDNPDSGMLECFPPALRHRLAEDGSLSQERVEIIAADARPGRDGKQDALLKLIAGLLEVPFDELKQRERARLRWARIRLAAKAFCVCLLVVLAWIAVADAGLHLPGGEWVRKTLDRHEASVLRAVPEEAEIKGKAASLRRDLVDALLAGQLPDGWLNATLKPGDRVVGDVWTQGHSAMAILSAPESDRTDKLRIAGVLNRVFRDSPPIVDGGDRLGWLSHATDVDTIAEPTLWMTIAHASLLCRKGLLGEAESREAMAHLAHLQEILETYRTDESGGWNMYPRQENPALHSPYSTSLALFALLETRRAGMPWNGSAENRDKLLAATVGWLCQNYDTAASVHGWRTDMGSYDVSDGLTLQNYYLLLRAEAEAGLAIPPGMHARIPGHLISCAERGISFPFDQGEFTVPYLGVGGRRMVGKEAIGYLWHPWAIGACQLWLRSSAAENAAPEDRVRVRRTLAHLVINLGDDAFKEARHNWAFIPAELLFNLSTLDP